MDGEYGAAGLDAHRERRDIPAGRFSRPAFTDAERRFIAENRPTSLLGRLIDPKEIGDAVAFVCSERASAINGAAVRVDGGLVRSVF